MYLLAHLLSRLSGSSVHAAYLLSGLGALRAALRARDIMSRAQIEMWRAQNRRKTCPKELWASDFEALEVSGTPRGDQESLKEIPKSSKVTIHRACRVIMSSPGATGDIDPAATQRRSGCDPAAAQLRPPFGPSNISRRRGPLKLMSKLIS